MLCHMIIHFVRHGETEFHENGKYAGQIDISLNKNGFAQSIRLSNWAKKQTLDLIVASDLKRALETAQQSTECLNQNLRIDSRFREIDFGELSGLNREEIRNNFSKIYEVFYNQPTQAVFPRGETVIDAMNRALLGILDLSNEPNLNEILIVSHATLFRLVLCVLLGINPNEYRTHFPELRNVSISTIEMPKGLDFSQLVGSAKLICFDKEITA